MKDNLQKLVAEHEEYALIKMQNKISDFDYIIMFKADNTTLILEDYDEAISLIKEWLKCGIEIFQNHSQFLNKYPPMSHEERLARGRVFLWQNISKEKWTNEISDYFENDPYWREFRSRNNL